MKYLYSFTESCSQSLHFCTKNELYNPENVECYYQAALFFYEANVFDILIHYLFIWFVKQIFYDALTFEGHEKANPL